MSAEQLTHVTLTDYAFIAFVSIPVEFAEIRYLAWASDGSIREVFTMALTSYQ